MDINPSSFSHEPNLATCKPHIRVVETVLGCPSALVSVFDEALDVSRGSYHDGTAHVEPSRSDAVLINYAAKRYAAKTDG